MAGDGGLIDIGFQGLMHSWFRKEKFTTIMLDNEVYGMLLDTGVIGLAVWACTMVAVCSLILSATARSDAATRHLGGALVACIVALLASTATFDAFAYRILLGSLFVLIGCGAALRRLERASASGTVGRAPLPVGHPLEV